MLNYNPWISFTAYFIAQFLFHKNLFILQGILFLCNFIYLISKKGNLISNFRII